MSDEDETYIQDARVTITGLMGIEVRPDETFDDAVERELTEEMTPERAKSFFEDAITVEANGERVWDN